MPRLSPARLEDHPALRLAADRARALSAEELYAAVRRGLARVPVLQARLGPKLRKLRDGEALVAALADRPDQTAWSLAMVALWEVDPVATLPLLTSLRRSLESQLREGEMVTLLALPPDMVEEEVARRGLLAPGQATSELVHALVFRSEPADRAGELLKNIEHWTTPRAKREVPRARSAVTVEPPELLSLVEWELSNHTAPRVPVPTLVELIAAGRAFGEEDERAFFAARPELATLATLKLVAHRRDRFGGSAMDRFVDWLVERLAEARPDGLEAVLGELVRDHPELPRASRALDALFGLRTRAAWKELVDLVERAVSTRRHAATPRERALARAAARHAAMLCPEELDTVAPHLAPAVLRCDLETQVALGFLSGIAALSDDAWKPVARGWGVVAAPLLGSRDREVAAAARDVLARLPGEELSTLLPVRAGPAPHTSVPGATPRWRKRYEAGEHGAVWREMRAAGDAVLASDEALEVAKATMKRLRQELARIVGVLRAGGVAFRLRNPLPPPEQDVALQLATLEAAIGVPVPLALRALHEELGAIDLTLRPGGDAKPPLRGLDAAGPLVIVPLSITKTRALAAVASQRALAPALRSPPTLLVHRSPDADGGDEHELLVSGHPADGVVLRGDGPALHLVDHLRNALATGGFLGLARHPHADAVRALLTADRIPF